jgi:hypothetical protein
MAFFFGCVLCALLWAFTKPRRRQLKKRQCHSTYLLLLRLSLSVVRLGNAPVA